MLGLLFLTSGMSMILPLATQETSPATQQSLFSDAEKDDICHAFAEFSEATIEAREAGVPIDVVLKSIREMPTDFMPDAASAAWLRSFIREGVVNTYAEPLVGRKPDRDERQQLINRFTAECLLGFDDGTKDRE